MNVRILSQDDLEVFNTFCGGVKGGMDPNQDILFGVFQTVGNTPNCLVAVLAARKVFYMHELRLVDESSPIARRIVENLYHYAMGAGRILSAPDNVQSALIRVGHDRPKMLEFHKDHGALECEQGTLLLRKI